MTVQGGCSLNGCQDVGSLLVQCQTLFLFLYMYAFKSQNGFGPEAIINGCGILCLFFKVDRSLCTFYLFMF